MRQILDQELDGIREAGTWKHERIITSPQGSSIQVTGRSDQILNFCANNYLGLSVSSLKLFVFHSNTRQTALTLGVLLHIPDIYQIISFLPFGAQLVDTTFNARCTPRDQKLFVCRTPSASMRSYGDVITLAVSDTGTGVGLEPE